MFAHPSSLFLLLLSALLLGSHAAANDVPRKQPASGGAQANLRGHGGPVKAIATDPATGRILTGSFDYAMMLWRVRDDGTAEQVRRFDDHDGAVSAVAFVPGGRNAIAASDDGTLTVWNLDSGKLIKRLKGHGAKILGIDVNASGTQLVSASWDRTVRLWNLETGQPIHTFSGHKGPVNAARFAHDGQHIVSASHDGTLNRWSIAKRSLVRVAHRHGWGINVLERLPSPNTYVFGALDGSVKIINLATDKSRLLEKYEKPVLSLAHLAKPGLLATGAGSGIVRVYRSGDWSKLEQHKNPFGPVWAMAFADRGARLYYGGLDDFVTAWQVVPRKPFEPVQTKFPRRFQVKGTKISLGERQFARKCSICHTLGPNDANRAGPTLYRVFGRRIGSLPGYPYSPALKTLDIVWTEATISKLFEQGPHEYTPGSKMPLQQITDREKRDALIAFLKAATEPASPDKKPSPDKRQ